MDSPADASMMEVRNPATGSVIMRTLVYRHGDSLVMATISALGPSAAELEPTVLGARGLP